MKTFLIDMPTMTSFWVTAGSEELAIAALYAATDGLELRLHIGDDDNAIEMVDTTCRHGELGDYEVISGEDDDEDEGEN